MCFVFFNSLDVISSVPAEDDSFIFSIKDRIPLKPMLKGGISGRITETNSVSTGSDSFVNTGEKAALNILAHSEQLNS